MDRLTAYLENDFARIKGWCSPAVWDTIRPLAEAIRGADSLGPVCEIGVQHGKFFIGLIKLSGALANHCAIDVFDLEPFGAHHAGQADRKTFEANLATSGIPAEAVRIIATDSLWLSDLDAHEMLAQSGGASLFSIDGSRRSEHVASDLAFAVRVTRPSGIIFIDDYHSPNWPGVQEGVARYFFGEPAPRFVPLLFAANKLALCSPSFHARYLFHMQSHFREASAGAAVKRVKRFGVDTLTIAARPAPAAKR